MNRALYAAASGMAAQQQLLESIAQNLSSADVAGFKGQALTFSEIAVDGRTLGVRQSGTQTVFKQGKLVRGNGAFDVALDGPGFFRVRDNAGDVAYTRSGSFVRQRDGSLQNDQGLRLDGVRIATDAASITVSERGAVSIATPNGRRACGRIRVVQFAAPEQLRSSGGTAFYETPASGPPRDAATGADAPRVRFGVLEQSNVGVIEAMMQIMAAQRAYEANAKGVQAADEMLRIANNLSRA